MKKALYILGLTVAIIITAIFISPVHINRADAKQASGVVTSVYASGLKDAVIKISGINTSFCINRAFEKKFDLAALRSKVLGRKVNILYADSWTPLDPGCKKHIAELSVEEDLLYSELPK